MLGLISVFCHYENFAKYKKTLNIMKSKICKKIEIQNFMKLHQNLLFMKIRENP